MPDYQFKPETDIASGQHPFSEAMQDANALTSTNASILERLDDDDDVHNGAGPGCRKSGEDKWGCGWCSCNACDSGSECIWCTTTDNKHKVKTKCWPKTKICTRQADDS